MAGYSLEEISQRAALFRCDVAKLVTSRDLFGQVFANKFGNIA